MRSTTFSRGSPPVPLYWLLIYSSAFEPDGLGIREQHFVSRPTYEHESFLGRGLHMMSFRSRGLSLVEVITPDESIFPIAHRVATLQCAADRDHSRNVENHFHYITTVQNERIEGNQQTITLREMMQDGEKQDAICTTWQDDGTDCESASLLRVQHLAWEVHAQTWHFDARSGLVVRTQAMFQILNST